MRSKSTYKKSSKKATTKKTVRKIAKDVVLDNIETKNTNALGSVSSVADNTLVIATAISNGVPALYLLNNLSQGFNEVSRIGDQAKAQKITMSMNISAVATSVLNQKFRYIIFWYKNPRGVAPTALDFFGTATPTTFTGYNFNTVDFQSRYTVIRDKMFNMSDHNQSLLAASTLNYDINPFSINLKNKSCDYTLGNAGTIADIDKNALYIWFLGNASSGANSVTVTTGGNYFFKDA